DFDVRGGGPQTRAGALSGGNQQKVVVAREVARNPKVLIAAQPTHGLDVGAIEYVHRRLVAERGEGRALLPVSLELDEVMSLFAFAMAMIVVAVTGHNPFKAFKGIFDGTGLNWLFPWVMGAAREEAAFNLQQTLILTTGLILTGFAVSFAFKCGLFNIGGQG